MPSSITCQTKVWVEPLPSLQVLLEGAAECDLALLPRWGSDSRKREALAWRRIVRRELGVDAELSYNEVGAPVILNKKGYISVSHNAEYVAVAYSTNFSPKSVSPTPKKGFSRKILKFSVSEANLAEPDGLSLGLIIL